jgi:hypothetical protein
VALVVKDLHVAVVVRSAVGKRHTVIEFKAGRERGNAAAPCAQAMVAKPNALALPLQCAPAYAFDTHRGVILAP